MPVQFIVRHYGGDILKRLILSIFCLGFLNIILPYVLEAATQPPHVPENGVNCDSCHLPANDAVWATGTDPDRDQNDPVNRICWKCHNDVTAPFRKTHSSTSVNSARYGEWRWNCAVCHNPHQQMQTNSNAYLPGLTGTITAVDAQAKTFTLSAGLPPRPGAGDASDIDDYAGWTIVPNRTYKTINYKIASNNGTLVTVTTAINAARVQAGSEFGILPGMLVKDTISVSEGPKSVRYLAREGQNSFVHNDGLSGGQDSTPTGICQVCHGLRTQGASISRSRSDGTGFGDGHATDSATDCTLCHDHGSSGFGASCSSCHGYPPAGAGSLVSMPAPTGSATAGAHSRHATPAGMNYSCDTCHFSGMPASAVTGNNKIQIGFNLFSGAYAGAGTLYRGQTLINGYTYEYTNSTAQGTTAFQCSNIYCHGRTASGTVWGNGTNTSPLWNGSVSCGDCHAATAASPPLLGSHDKHARQHLSGYSYACGLCHKDPGTDSSLHSNNRSEVIFSADPKTAGGGYSGSDAMLDAYGSCTNIYCHSTVQSSPPGAAPVYRTSPTWGDNNSLGCGGCHDYSPALASGSHTSHFNAYPETQECFPCHNWSNSDDSCMACHDWDTLEPRRDKHANNSVDIAFAPFYGGSYSGSPQPGDSYGNCSNVYCHGATLAGGTNTSPVWGSSVACGDCHYATFSTTVFTPPSGRSHMRHTGTASRQQGMVCADCHGVNGSGSAGHVDAAVQWSLNTSKAGADAKYRGAVSGTVNSKAPSATYGQCTNSYCHSNVQPDGGVGSPDVYFSPTWGDSSVSTCEACHRSVQGDNHSSYNTIGTGSHTSHLSYTFTTAPSAKSFVCAVCHLWKLNATLADSCTYTCHTSTYLKHANSLVEVAFIADFNPGGTAAYSGTPAPGDGYGACSNTYCHSDGTSVATGTVPANSSSQWGTPGPLACGACHGYPPSFSNGSPKANSHLSAFHNGFGCDSCHYATTSNGITITDKTKHVNRSYDVAPNTGAGISFSYTFAPAGGTCADTSCHAVPAAPRTWGGL